MNAIHIAGFVCWATIMATTFYTGKFIHELADIFSPRESSKDEN
jgi:hypothetical protein